MFNVSKQSLKSYFAYAYTDFKKTMTIGIIITSSMFLLQLIIVLITSLTGNISSDSNSGMLISGYGTLVLTFMIGVFVDTSNGHMKNVFRFPINRPTYAVGTLLNIFIVPLAMIAVTSLFQSIETIAYSLTSAMIGDLVYLNNLTAASYLEGILPSYAAAVLVLSFVYMLSMYFHRFKLPFVIALVAWAVLYTLLGDFRVVFNRILLFPFSQQSIPVFTLCALGMSLVFNAMAFVPLKVMEVK